MIRCFRHIVLRRVVLACAWGLLLGSGPILAQERSGVRSWNTRSASAAREMSLRPLRYQEELPPVPRPMDFSDGELVAPSEPPGPAVDAAIPYEYEGGEYTSDGNTFPAGQSIRINPLALPQGIAHLAFDPSEPLPQQELGFPFTMVPARFFEFIPRIDLFVPRSEMRASGRGEPLRSASWRNRPWHLDFFAGGLFTDNVIPGTATPDGGTFLGARLGWDTSYHFGGEFRIGLSELSLAETSKPLDLRIWDLRIQYYPWGDARFRPYTMIGAGVAEYRFVDSLNTGFRTTTFNMPIGIGLKYYFKSWVSIRVELEDNISFSSRQLNTMHHWAFTGSVELRFGGRRRTYFPFNSSRVLIP